MTESYKNKFLIVTEDDGLEWYMYFDNAIIVPLETLDSERLQRIEEGDTEKLLKHGGEFPGIYISEILETLDSEGLFEPMLQACRLTRMRLDGEEMPDEPELVRPKMTRILTQDEMVFVDFILQLFEDKENWPDGESAEVGMPIAPDSILGDKGKNSKEKVLELVREGWFTMEKEDYIKPTEQAYRNVAAIRELLKQ